MRTRTPGPTRTFTIGPWPALASLLAWCLLLAGPAPVPTALADGDDDNEAAGDEAESASPRLLVTRAEQLELEGRYDRALAVRESALAGFDEQLQQLGEWLTAARRHVEGGSDEPSAPTPGHVWIAFLQRERAAVQAERDRCAYWLAELQKDEHGTVPHLRHDRGIVWAHEAEINDAINRLRKLEDRSKWEAAHAARRKCLILAKAKRRFFEAKIDALKRTLRHVKRNRKLKETDAVTRVEEQIAFYETVRSWADGRIERFEEWVNAEADPAINEAEVELWANWEDTAARLGAPTDAVSREVRGELLARARGRAAWYGADDDSDDE